LNAIPRLLSVDGTTKVQVKGFGFVNSGEVKAKYDGPTALVMCNGQPCIKEATYIDKQTLETTTFPQLVMNYKENGDNIMWDPLTIDASVYGNDFTDNNVELWYY